MLGDIFQREHTFLFSPCRKLYGMSLRRNYARSSHLRIPATQTCGWAWSPGVLTDPYARREKERERERERPEWPEPQHRRTNSAGNRGVRRLAFEAGWGLVLPGSGFESR